MTVQMLPIGIRIARKGSLSVEWSREATNTPLMGFASLTEPLEYLPHMLGVKDKQRLNSVRPH
jgi:hypothetical protein